MSHFIYWFKEMKFSKIIIYILGILAIFFVFYTLIEIAGINSQDIPDPNKIVNLLLLDLTITLLIGGILLRRFLKIFYSFRDSKAGSRLQKKIIMTFGFVTILPTVLVSIFSIFFFNYGMQSWFNQRMDAILEQSLHVANKYIDEHKRSLKITSLDAAKNLAKAYSLFLEKPGLINEVLDSQAEVSFLDEIFLFRTNIGKIVAMSGANKNIIPDFEIPIEFFHRAKRGEVVEIVTDPYHIRYLSYCIGNDYLIIGRLIDKEVLDYINKTNGAAENYISLKNQSSDIQIKFSIAFVIVTLLLLSGAISFGIILSSQIVMPIASLLRASERVKNGDLTVRVNEIEHKDDEIGILSKEFNRMIQQIDRQQKELIIAQRSMAWSEVAKRVAHEIKNPLTPIQLASDRLMSKFKDKSEDPDMFARYVNTILRHIDDIKKIVTEFVNSTRLPTPTFQEGDIVSFLREIIDARKMIKEKYIYNFSSNVDECYIAFDPNQINQAMVNLLKNAEESLETIKNGKINIDIVVNLQYVMIQISDNGKGFPPELLNRISEPYLTTRTKGTGLGLSIVKKIINDHSGGMEFSNLETGGAMIKLTLDIEQLTKHSVK